jgi:hypothetical protein
MKKMKILAAIFSTFITIPIWMYLFYQVLVRIQATELMFFLYWIYVPAHVFMVFVTYLMTDAKKEG